MAARNTPKTSRRGSRGTDVPPPEDEENLPERWHPRRRGFFSTLSRLLFFSIVLLLLALPFTPYAGKIKRTLAALVEKARETKVVFRDVPKTVIQEKTVFQDKVVEKIVEVAAPPPPLPSAYVPRKDVDAATLFNGITIQTKLETSEGTYASIERTDKDAYTVEFQLKVRVPRANQSLAELARINPELPQILPGLGPMLDNGSNISGFYHKLYDRKTASVQQNLTRLNRVLDRHNFFDCETILELTHPQSKRRVMLIQSEMDVVTDGSDGDRMPQMGADIYNSDHYQPFTSYEWAKQGTGLNPLLPRWQARLDSAKAEFAKKGLSSARNAELRAEVQEADRIVKALKARSSLIAEKDPFIVISLVFRDYPKVHPFAPSMGDYAAVIHGNQILPAICGDYGPSMKMGEASLMMAKKVNPKATSYSRPESDLKVTYLIFPGTAEKPFGPPNLEKWQAKVTEYLNDVGGLGAGYTLHVWENPFPAPAPASVPIPPPTTIEPAIPGTVSPPATTPSATPTAAGAPLPPVVAPSSPTSPVPAPQDSVIPATKSAGQ